MMSADAPEKIRCGYCLSTFEPERPWQKFCAEKCRNGWHSDKRAAEKEKKKHERKKNVN